MGTWIFQGNPKRFDIDTYLRQQSIVLWTVGNSPLQNSIQIDDDVFIWRSDGGRLGSGGLIAKGKILDTPKYIQDDARELWHSKDRLGVSNRVKIILSDTRLTIQEGMVPRSHLQNDSNLASMGILRYRAATVFKLSEIHAEILEKYWRSFKK